MGKKKPEKKKSFVAFILKNIAFAIIIVVALVGITFWGINKYTQHGIVEVVPDLRNMYVEEADMILRKTELYTQVIDSVYARDREFGIIIDQIPAPNSTIKRGRPVYLIINSKQVRSIEMPDINDYSSRQATAVLEASGISIESIQYIPSLYKDLVIDVKYRGVSILPGTEIPEGESVVLIVGSGLGEESTLVPNVRGLTFEVARQEILNSYFTPGATYYDVEPEENTDESLPYIIYRQHPTAGKKVPSGTRIDVWLSTDPAAAMQNIPVEEDDDSEEDFF